jgi:Carboxypeptidase regulatory-like domain
MNRKATISLLVGSILALLLSLPTRAQVVGATISGTITDARGDSVPNAKVTAKDLATGVSTSTTTNTYGAYSIPNLNPAEYEISASATGFSTARTKATLTVGAKQEVNFSLKVGQVTEVVEVSGAAPAVDTTNSTLTAEVDSTTVRELPLNGRDWASLAQLQPGVAGVRTQELITQVGAVGRGLGTQISIDGNRPTQNSYRLNGIFINDYSNAGPGNVLGGNLGVDGIQEFSVITSNYSAEYGYTSGGVVNAITKQGTNQFHGTAFEFLRNSALDARNFFENSPVILPKSPFRRNQFGGSAGGPIKKDKIWIFGTYEGLRQSKGIPHSVVVPSENARQGILSVGNVTVNQPYLTFFPHCPVANNISPGDTCLFSFSGAQVVPDNYGNGRGDVKFSDNDKMSASFYYDHSTFTQPDNFNQKLEGFFVGRKGASIEETHLFTSNLVNTLRVGWNYTQGFGQLTPSAINPNAASTDTTNFAIEDGLHAARISGIGGGKGVPEFNAPFSGGLNGDAVEDFTHQTVQTFDDAGLTIGRHGLKFGFMFIRLEEKLFAPFTSNGTAAFAPIPPGNALFPAGLTGLQAFLMDVPFKVQSPPLGGLKTVKTRYMFASIPGVYFQDDWKVRSNLTLNMGLRYEMETIPTEKHGLIANLPNIWTNPTTENCSTCTNKNFDSNPTSKNFEPRVGFAWDPFRDGKTSVRGGFGLFDSLPLPYELALNNAQTSPGHVNVTANGCAFVGNVQPCVGQGEFPNLRASPSCSAAGVTCVYQQFLNPASAPIAGQTWNFVERKPHRNYIYQWNFNLQRQLVGDVSLTVAYAGSRGFHNPYQTDDLNIVFPTKVGNRWIFPNPVGSAVINPNPTGIVSGQLINPNVAGIQSTIWQSKSWYDSLQVEVNKRMSHGLQAEVSFTWSKTEDTSSGSFAGDNFAGDLNPTIPWWDLKLIKGLSDFNVSRNLVVNLLWQVPTPASFHGPAAFITKGWELGGILTLSDGVPFWPFTIAGDLSGQLMSEPYAIPDRVPGCKLTNAGNPNQYTNPACVIFAVAPSGINPATSCDQSFIAANTISPGVFAPGVSANTCINLLGNLGRNTYIGPGLFNLDYSMVKNTKIPKISENFNVQFRAEFFNILNRANFAPPVNNLDVLSGPTIGAPPFGQINTTQSPERQIQFGLKFIW